MAQSTPQSTEQRAAERHDLPREIHHDITRMLERRTAPVGTLRARAEGEAKRGGARVWQALKKRPSVGAVVVGGLAIVAADAVGIGELAMGVTMAFAAWRVLRKGEPVDQADEEAERLGRR